MSSKRIDKALARLRAIPGLEGYAADVLETLATEAGRADRESTKFHWGRAPQTASVVEVPRVAPGEVLYALGELTEISYDTRKGTPEWIRYVHEFRRKLPVLAATQSGRLVIVGGSYKITERGIVG